jgi:CheY-like chemotaxis protein
MAPRITVVNDNPEFLELVREILEDEHYATTTIDGDFGDALLRVVESRPDLLILDLRLGTDELHGWGLAQQLRREPSLEGLPVISAVPPPRRSRLSPTTWMTPSTCGRLRSRLPLVS